MAEFFGPRAEDDVVSESLRLLTFHLQQQQPNEEGGGDFFGGSFGYGAAFENDVFLMHPYCWCDKNDGSCLWCLHGDHPEFIARLHARFGTTQAGYYDKVTHYYDPPHFWHKASDFRVRWYKYIGRDNALNRADVDLRAIVTECLASIGVPSLEEGVAAYAKGLEEDTERQRKAAAWATSDEGQRAFDEMLKSGAIQMVTFGPDDPSDE